MTTFADLKKRVAFLAQDPTMEFIPDSQYGEFINDAVRDLTMSGWLLPLDEDTSLTMAQNTYEYAVPAGFAYIYCIYEESDTTPTTYDIVAPFHQWRLAMKATATPYIVFNADLWYPRAGKKFLVRGQKRPSLYSVDSDTIEALFEGFLRERAAAYALYFAATLPQPGAADYIQKVEDDSPTTRRGPVRPGFATERSRNLAALANIKMASSERMLTFHPQELRVKPSSRHVPGR
jgi:hypothetical protein